MNIYKTFLAVAVAFSLFSGAGCRQEEEPVLLGEAEAVPFSPDSEEKRALMQEIDSPLLAGFFMSPEFRVYPVQERKRDYDRITLDFYRSPSFGLFTPVGKQRAADFAEEYGDYLQKAVERFRLSGEAIPVIVALAGMESRWGYWNPQHRAFNALFSAYEQMPARREFTLQNIRGLIDGIENPYIQIDAFDVSSFMGAVGYCQLMPFWFTEITRRKIEKQLDLSGDGVFNPFSMPDAIAFFAWYLSEHGFNRNPRLAVRRYNGSGPAAESFADAVMEFAQLLQKQL